MQRAGQAITEQAIQEFESQSIAILIGPGNNGADGILAGSGLTQRGKDITLVSPFKKNTSKNLLGKALRVAKQCGLTVNWEYPNIKNLKPDLWIDALLGVGQSRPLEGRLLSWIATLQTTKSPILAIDIPTGLNGTNGSTTPIAVPATQTLTFFAPKVGFYQNEGPAHCGKISVATLETNNQSLKNWLKKRRTDLPKG